MSTMSTLVELLSEALHNEETNVSAFARQCGCSRQYLYDIAKGLKQPTLPLAEKICDVLGVELLVRQKKAKKLTA